MVALLFQTISSTTRTHLEERKVAYKWSRYFRDKLQFGTLWKVYIPAMTYDVLHSSVYREQSSNHRPQETLRGLIGNILLVLSDRHPCRRGTFVVYGLQLGKKFFVQHTNEVAYFLAADYRICGVYNFTYNPSYYTDESFPGLNEKNLPCPDDKPLRVSWNLQAGEDFGINCTLSEFSTPRSHGCADARILMKSEKMIPFQICPKYGKWNFVALHITVTLVLHYYQNPFFTEIGDQKYTKLSFYYHILDFRNVSVSYAIGAPTRQLVKLGMEHTFQIKSFDSTFPNVSYLGLEYILKLPCASVFAFAINIADLLTPVIYRNKFTCNIPGAEAIFYDGPVQTLWQPALPILTYWRCSPEKKNNTTTSHDDDEARGSVGELNIIFFVPKRRENDSSYLEITWQAQHMLPSALRIREVVLNFSESATIDFHPTTTTLLDVVHVQAPEGKFIQLSFTDIHYVTSSEIQWNVYFGRCLDGFKIKGNHIKGPICSNHTAERLLSYYQKDGLILGQKVTLTRKQYGWLLPMSAVVIANPHSCVGYANVFPTWKNMLFSYRIPQAIVRFSMTNEYFGNGSFARYSELRIFFTCLSQACCKLQIVPFSDLEFYELKLSSRRYNYLKYTITSEDLTSPSRFIIDFASIGNMVEFQNVSSVYGLRIYSLNNRCRLAKQTSPYTGIWDTDAYSAQIGLHSSILTHAAGFSIKVVQGSKLPVCIKESGMNVTAMFFDVNLLGPCANADLNVQEVHFVLIHNIHKSQSCCRFDGYIAIHSTHGSIALSLRQARKYKIWNYNHWVMSDRDNIVNFRVLCTQLCWDITIELHLDRRFLMPFSIGYNAKLIEQYDMARVTFTQTSSPLGFKSPRVGPITWNQVCLNHRCYVTPRNHKVVTWDQAKTACQEKGANLVSINSDLEWALLTRLPKQIGEEFIELYNIHNVILIYVGLVTDVSTNIVSE